MTLYVYVLAKIHEQMKYSWPLNNVGIDTRITHGCISISEVPLYLQIQMATNHVVLQYLLLKNIHL